MLNVVITADSYENDDDRGLASTLDNATPQDHNIHVVGDADWLTFTVAVAIADVEIKISGSDNDETQLTLYDSGQEEVAFNGSPNSHAIISLATLPAGTYFILVNEIGNDKTIGNYSIALTYSEAVSDGDLNADGVVTLADVLLAERILIGEIALTQDYLDRGDVAPLVGGIPAPDSVFGLGDLLVISRKAMGIVNF